MTALAQALSAALLDFVWQGLLVAALLWIALFILRDRSARARYAVSCLALGLMAVLPAITAYLIYTAPIALPLAVDWAKAGPPAARAIVAATSTAPFDWSAWVERWALPAWFLGVLIFSLRLVWAARQVAAVRRRSQAPEDAILHAVTNLGARMKLARPVRLLITAAADCPSVVGWIRPVLLLPAATMAGLTPEQLEAVLAHELAHIMRYDYLVNMLQTVVETLLFYHPAVWWASSRIRHERELCCDDLAVESCGDALCYARALTKLERLRVAAPGLALGSTGGSLMYRIRRVMGEGRQGNAPSKLPGILALSLGLICLALNMPWARGQQQEAPAAAATDTSVDDDPGVRVDVRGAAVMDREPVEYPGPAAEKGVVGTVVVEATLDSAGEVTDARVLSGPVELRKAALESVLHWHFTQGSAVSEVSITFEKPAEGTLRQRLTDHPRRGISGGIGGGIGSGVGGGVSGGISGGVGGGISGGVGGGVGGGIGLGSEALMERDQRAREAEQHARQMLLESEEAQKAVAHERQADLNAQMLNLEAELSALRQSYRNTQPETLEWQARLKELEQQRQTLQSQMQNLKPLSEALSEHVFLKEAESQREEMAKFAERMAELQSGLQNFHDPLFTGRKVKSITIRGLSSAMRDELVRNLPVHVGDTLAEDSLQKIEAAVKQFDERLGLSMFTAGDGLAEIRITAPGSGDKWEPHP